MKRGSLYITEQCAMLKTNAHLISGHNRHPREYHPIFDTKIPLPRLFIWLLLYHDDLDHTNQHDTSLYIVEQCCIIKPYVSLISHPGCIITIWRILSHFWHKNTIPSIDILLCQHNIRLDRINQHNTPWYIREQSTTIKLYASLISSTITRLHFTTLKISKKNDTTAAKHIISLHPRWFGPHHFVQRWWIYRTTWWYVKNTCLSHPQRVAPLLPSPLPPSKS